MRKFYNSLIIIKLLIFIFLSGCQDFVIEENVTGNYYLIATDIYEDLALSYKLKEDGYLGVVGETVFSVGFNDDYIIAKQHPFNMKHITNYFIIPIYKEYTLYPEKGIIGPMNYIDFNKKLKELGIYNKISFTIDYDKLK